MMRRFSLIFVLLAFCSVRSSVLTSFRAMPYQNSQAKPPFGAQINWGHPLAPGLVLMVPFDNDLAFVVKDLSPNGLDLPSAGGSFPPWTGSPYGWASGPYSGSAAWINTNGTFQSTVLPTGTAGRTIAVLFRVVTDSTTKMSLFFYGTTGSNGQMWVMGYSGTTDNAGAKANSLFVDCWNYNTYIPWTRDTGWHLLTAINPAGNNASASIILCLDGVCPAVSTNGTITINTTIGSGSNMDIGTWKLDNSTVFTGLVAGVWMWNYAFDTAKVSQLWQGPFAMLSPAPRRLLAAPGGASSPLLRRRTVTIQ